VGAAIVTGVKLVTPLAMAGMAMPPLAAVGRGLIKAGREERDPPLALAGHANVGSPANGSCGTFQWNNFKEWNAVGQRLS